MECGVVVDVFVCFPASLPIFPYVVSEIAASGKQKTSSHRLALQNGRNGGQYQSLLE